MRDKNLELIEYIVCCIYNNMNNENSNNLTEHELYKQFSLIEVLTRIEEDTRLNKLAKTNNVAIVDFMKGRIEEDRKKRAEKNK